MSRKEDVIDNFMNLGITQTIKSQHIKNIIRYAVGYGFEQGESFGKYGAFVEKQNEKIAEAIIQPENDRAWREELESIKKDDNAMNLNLSSVQWKIVHLLYLIVDILLVRKNGG